MLLVGDEAYLRQGAEASLERPQRLSLAPVAPNPARGAVRLRFGLPERGRVTLEVYGVDGRRVAGLVQEREYEAGQHALVWEPRDAHGAPLPSGVYFCRLSLGSSSLVRRVVVVR